MVAGDAIGTLCTAVSGDDSLEGLVDLVFWGLAAAAYLELIEARDETTQ